MEENEGEDGYVQDEGEFAQEGKNKNKMGKIMKKKGENMNKMGGI